MSTLLDNLRRLLASLEDEADTDAEEADVAAPPPAPAGPLAPPDCEAARVMRELNPRAFVAKENGLLVAIEEIDDCPEDARTYKLEYRSTLDGRGAVAFCLSNPWDRENVQAGTLVSVSHVFSDGLLCLGADHARDPSRSPRSLRDTVLRARFWCTGFSVLEETGSFPNL